MPNNTILEEWFFKNAKDFQHFPDASANYVLRYNTIKDYLVKNVYPLIGAATSAKDSGIYTDHGPEHFDQVIRYASKLLGLENGDENITLNVYEIFLLLTSILLHDAGNIFGRDEHEKKPFEILLQMGPTITTDNIEKKIIANIAEVHGGRSATADKDTIGARFVKEKETYLNTHYQPKIIASVVRFADEICEDRTRAARFLLDGDLPAKSEVFHEYANSITSVNVDKKDKSVQIQYDLLVDKTQKKFGKNESQVYLIDEIFERLEKMNCEKIYCRRFAPEIIKIDSIKAVINILDDEYELIENLSITCEESGYPDGTINLSVEHSDWIGDTLKKKMGVKIEVKAAR